MEDGARLNERILAVPGAYISRRYAHIEDYAQPLETASQQIDHYKDLKRGRYLGINHWGRRPSEANHRRCHQTRHQHMTARLSQASTTVSPMPPDPLCRAQFRRLCPSSVCRRVVHRGEFLQN